MGAGGGRSNVRSVSGGAGGSAEGTFTFVKDQEYKLRIGGAGADGVETEKKLSPGERNQFQLNYELWP